LPDTFKLLLGFYQGNRERREVAGGAVIDQQKAEMLEALKAIPREQLILRRSWLPRWRTQKMPWD